MLLIQLPLGLYIVTLIKLILQQENIMGHFLVVMELFTLTKIQIGTTCKANWLVKKSIT